MATEDIGQEEELMRIPLNIIINSWIALQTKELQPVYMRFEKFFHWDFECLWEDHILIIFMLYEL